MKRISIFMILAITSTLIGCGNSSESSSNDNKVTVIETQNITEESTQQPTELIVENETELTEEETDITNDSFERNSKVENLLKAGYSFDGMGEPTINFIDKTNTYVVIAPTSSDEIGIEFENDNDKWNEYVEKFTLLTNNIVDTISETTENQNINFRITHTLKTPLPLLCYENGNIVFDRYNAKNSDQAIFALRVICDMNFLNTIGDANIEYDTDNNYIVKFAFSSDSIDFFKDKEFSDAFCALTDVFEETIKSYDDPSVTVMAINEKTGDTICIAENGKSTYSIFK